jgi:hypothetical protein
VGPTPKRDDFTSDQEFGLAQQQWYSRAREFWLSNAGAQAKLVASDYVLVSDADGSFHIDDVFPGEYELNIRVSDPKVPDSFFVRSSTSRFICMVSDKDRRRLKASGAGLDGAYPLAFCIEASVAFTMTSTRSPFFSFMSLTERVVITEASVPALVFTTISETTGPRTMLLTFPAS